MRRFVLRKPQSNWTTFDGCFYYFVHTTQSELMSACSSIEGSPRHRYQRGLHIGLLINSGTGIWLSSGREAKKIPHPIHKNGKSNWRISDKGRPLWLDEDAKLGDNCKSRHLTKPRAAELVPWKYDLNPFRETEENRALTALGRLKEDHKGYWSPSNPWRFEWVCSHSRGWVDFSSSAVLAPFLFQTRISL